MWEKYKHIVQNIDTGPGALGRAALWIRRHGKTLVVCDANTLKAAGNALLLALDGAGAAYDLLVYPDQVPAPAADQNAVGRLCCAYTPDIGAVVGVGSGTINDICKFFSFRAGRPCIAVGTAPSMDGYASAGAAMTIDGVKVTPRCQCPEAIFCDPDVMKDAPMPMLAAGLGDILGKASALADWRLSHLLTGEPMPPDLYCMVEDALRRCKDSAAGLAERRPEAINNVTEALILSGIAMTLYGDSRPASGAEHHISHYWEMRFIAENKPPVLHGLKVGVATLTALGLWRDLPETPAKPEPEHRSRAVEAVRRAYGFAADELLKTPNPNLPFERINGHWAEIKAIAASLPAPGEVAGLLERAGAPVTPDGIGVDEDMLADSIFLARERKKTYTVLQLMGDLGLLRPPQRWEEA